MKINRRVGSFLVAFLLCVTLCYSAKTTEDESKENHIGVQAQARQYAGFVPSSWRQTGLELFNGLAMPVLFLLLISALTNLGTASIPAAAAGAAGAAGRKKRSPIAGWSDNLRKILGNVQKALDKMQHFEEEIENDINEDNTIDRAGDM